MLQLLLYLSEPNILYIYVEPKVLHGKERKVSFYYILKPYSQNHARKGRYMKNLVLQPPAGTASVQVIVRCILLLYNNQDLFRSCE